MELWKSQADEEENSDLQNMDLSLGMDKALQVVFPPRQKSKAISHVIESVKLEWLQALLSSEAAQCRAEEGGIASTSLLP